MKELRTHALPGDRPRDEWVLKQTGPGGRYTLFRREAASGKVLQGLQDKVENDRGGLEGSLILASIFFLAMILVPVLAFIQGSYGHIPVSGIVVLLGLAGTSFPLGYNAHQAFAFKHALTNSKKALARAQGGTWQEHMTLSPGQGRYLTDCVTLLQEAGVEWDGLIARLEEKRLLSREGNTNAWLVAVARILREDPAYPLHLLPLGTPEVRVIAHSLQESMFRRQVESKWAIQATQDLEDRARMAGAAAYLGDASLEDASFPPRSPSLLHFLGERLGKALRVFLRGG